MGYLPPYAAISSLAAAKQLEEYERRFAEALGENITKDPGTPAPTLVATCPYCATKYKYEHPYKCPNCGAPAK
jgi:rubrerythrin